ncbi:hypothetical protein KC19_8G051000 [Ceratodon purpureus]|uniref:Uncharacterized protein n=1 Tax=Ceratodon purpureus TaxID=3225 RepID=A0A8T0GXQ7_CERPU|nr:hypothetical protein KC19_8G051000 [Ceratodon purpureus]
MRFILVWSLPPGPSLPLCLPEGQGKALRRGTNTNTNTNTITQLSLNHRHLHQKPERDRPRRRISSPGLFARDPGSFLSMVWVIGDMLESLRAGVNICNWTKFF